MIHLADFAMKRRKNRLAIKVFEAAMAKGDHHDLLTKKYENLERGHWSPDPRKQGRRAGLSSTPGTMLTAATTAARTGSGSS